MTCVLGQGCLAWRQVFRETFAQYFGRHCCNNWQVKGVFDFREPFNNQPKPQTNHPAFTGSLPARDQASFFPPKTQAGRPPPWTAARPNFVRGNPSGPDWIVEQKGLVSENFPMAGAKHQKFILDPKQASLVGFQYPGGRVSCSWSKLGQWKS